MYVFSRWAFFWVCGQSRLASLRWWFESQHKAPDDSVSFGLGCVIFPLSDSQPLPASCSLLRPLTSSSAVEGISPQKSILHSSSSSSSELLCKSSRSAPTVLGSASLLWLALASPAGCNDRLQTTLTPWTHHWTLCVCVCGSWVCTAVWNVPLTTLICLNHGWTHLDTHTQFLAPLSSMLGTGCTQRAH